MINSFYYILTSECMGRLAAVLNKTGDSARYRRNAITMKAALHSVMNLTSRQTNNITSLSVNATVPPPLQMKRC